MKEIFNLISPVAHDLLHWQCSRISKLKLYETDVIIKILYAISLSNLITFHFQQLLCKPHIYIERERERERECDLIALLPC